MSVHKKPVPKKRPRPILPLRWVNHSLDPALSRFKQYLPIQRTWQPQDTVSADELNQNVRDAVNFLLSPPRSHITMNNISQTVQAVQQTGPGMTPITFDTLVLDSDNMWDANVPSRLNINTPGLYKYRLYVHWQPNNNNGCSFIGLARGSGGIWPDNANVSQITSPKVSEDNQQWLKSATVGVSNFMEGYYQSTDQNDYLEAFLAHSINGQTPILYNATFTMRLVSQN